MKAGMINREHPFGSHRMVPKVPHFADDWINQKACAAGCTHVFRGEGAGVACVVIAFIQ